MPYSFNPLSGLGLDQSIPLDSAGKIPSGYLPSYVDDVEEYADLASFPATGETGKIYVAIDTGFTYRWSGSVYIQINSLTGTFAADSGTEGAPSVSIGTADNGLYAPGTDQVAISTSGTGRLFVDASGRIVSETAGIVDTDRFSTSNRIAYFRTSLNAGNQFGQIAIKGYYGAGINFLRGGTGAETNSAGIFSDLSDNLLFTSGGATERLRITSDGKVGLGTSSPAVAYDVVGQVRASTGILFGNDTAAANALDDYEEGTFTPTIAGTTAAGTATYTTQAGKYTKVGNTVVVTCRLEWSLHTGTGSIYIAGLPFTPAGQNAVGGIFCGTLSFVDAIVPRVLTGQTRVYPYSLNSGSSGTLVNITANGAFDCTITYYTS